MAAAGGAADSGQDVEKRIRYALDVVDYQTDQHTIEFFSNCLTVESTLQDFIDVVAPFLEDSMKASIGAGENSELANLTDDELHERAEEKCKVCHEAFLTFSTFKMEQQLAKDRGNQPPQALIPPDTVPQLKRDPTAVLTPLPVDGGYGNASGQSPSSATGTDSSYHTANTGASNQFYGNMAQGMNIEYGANNMNMLAQNLELNTPAQGMYGHVTPAAGGMNQQNQQQFFQPNLQNGAFGHNFPAVPGSGDQNSQGNGPNNNAPAGRDNSDDHCEGLDLWLRELSLAHYLEPAKKWCHEMGAVAFYEIFEYAEEFNDGVGLKPLEKRRVIDYLAKLGGPEAAARAGAEGQIAGMGGQTGAGGGNNNAAGGNASIFDPKAKLGNHNRHGVPSNIPSSNSGGAGGSGGSRDHGSGLLGMPPGMGGAPHYDERQKVVYGAPGTLEIDTNKNMPAPQDFAGKQTFGDPSNPYVILNELGTGAAGTVYFWKSFFFFGF